MSNPYTLVEPCIFDVFQIADNLREADRNELLVQDKDPVDVLMHGYHRSERLWTILYDGRPCGFVGVGDFEEPKDDLGVVWMLGTPDLTAEPLAFVRKCKERFGELFFKPRLCNVAHAENELHLRYLEFLGATFHEIVELNGHPFILFELEDPNV